MFLRITDTLFVPTAWNYEHNTSEVINNVGYSSVNPIDPHMLELWHNPDVTEIHLTLVNIYDKAATTENEYANLAVKHKVAIGLCSVTKRPWKKLVKNLHSDDFYNVITKRVWHAILRRPPVHNNLNTCFVIIEIIRKKHPIKAEPESSGSHKDNFPLLNIFTRLCLPHIYFSVRWEENLRPQMTGESLGLFIKHHTDYSNLSVQKMHDFGIPELRDHDLGMCAVLSFIDEFFGDYNSGLLGPRWPFVSLQVNKHKHTALTHDLASLILVHNQVELIHAQGKRPEAYRFTLIAPPNAHNYLI